MDREHLAMDAGRKIREGSRGHDELHTIARWKASRAAHQVVDDRNTQALVRAALDIAAADESEPAAKVDALVGLFGVNVPMASAILTCIHPEIYTIIDVRALDALGVKKRNIGKARYLRYVEFCRTTATGLGVELRQLDRALWKSGSIS